MKLCYRSTRMIIDNISYTEAIYFIYVTISTIGFGDFVIRFENQTKLNRAVRSSVVFSFWSYFA